MATITSIFVPFEGSTAGSTTADLSSTVLTVSSSAEIVLNRYSICAINANGDINIRRGSVGMPAAAATDFRLPANQTFTFQVPENWDRIRIYNPGGSTITYWIMFMTKTT
jgi:hypothetical protein